MFIIALTLLICCGPFSGALVLGNQFVTSQSALWFADEPTDAAGLPDSGLVNVSEVVWSGVESRGIYLGSPSIVRCPSNGANGGQKQGAWLSTHDLFGRGVPSGPKKSAYAYRSTDEGKSWGAVGQITPMYWSSLFVRDDDEHVYLLGTTNDGAPGPTQISIAASTDCGSTWQVVVLTNSTQSYSTGPTPVLVHAGRLWRAFEHNEGAGWASGYAAVVLSASANASNLLDPAAWVLSGELPFAEVAASVPRNWSSPVVRSSFGWLEGNAVAPLSADDIGVYIIMRVNSLPAANKAALLYLAGPTGQPSFRRFIEFPGGMSKFTIRYDPVSKLYVTLSNTVVEAVLSRAPMCAPVPWQPSGATALDLDGSEEANGHQDFPRKAIHSLFAGDERENLVPGEQIALPACSKDQLRLCTPAEAPCIWAHANARNNLSLVVSQDLVTWRVVRTVLADDTGAPEWLAQIFTGFQYVDWQFDGLDLVAAIRAAYRGADCYHNSNRILVQRLVDWRRFL
jgi:hypothetical protein